MKRNILVLLAIFCFLFNINNSLSVSSIEGHSPDFISSESPENSVISEQYENPPSASGKILVKFKKQANRRIQALIRASIEASYGIREIRYFSFIDVHLYEATWYKEMTLRGLNRNQNVEYAEEDFLVSIDSTFSNDPSFSNLWGLHNTGQAGGTTDADIDAPEAWDLSTGSSNVIVAVIDTGVDYNHQDLNANMWTNPGETPGNGIDDDGNGYVDDYYGINAITGSGDPMDDHSHGTHCSGTVAAVGNNGTGVVGVCWTARIMALKFLNSSGTGSTSNAVKCVEYAINKGAHIMSNSWGGGGYSQSLKNAIAAAKNAGIIFIAAAGNSGTNNDTSPHYPSSYDDDNIIAVTATDSSDNQWYNYGASSVDVAAPGRSIYSTILNNGYGYKSGTSMATPHVSGLAALIKAYNSGLNWQQIKNRILDNVEQKSSLAGKILTGGRINTYSSLNPGAVSPVISGTVYDPNSQGLEGVTITFSNSGGTATTDSNGNYSQTVTNGWSGTATPSKSGYTFSPSSRSYANVTSSQSGQNYNATATVLTISGIVKNSEGIGIGGVTITFSNGGGTATTESNGNYSQTVTNGWSGTSTPAKVGYTFSPSGRSYTNVTSSQSGQNYNATGTTTNYTISGNVYDSSGQGISGVTLTFSSGGGTATTDSNGDYSQTVSSGWSGTAISSLSGYTFSPSSRSYSNVNSNLVGQNYKATGTTTNPTISGTVTTTEGSGLAGVTLTFSNGGGTATSDSSGNYSQTVNSGWSGTAIPSLSGYTFSPSSRSYTNVTSSQSGQNYTAAATGSSEIMNGDMEDGTAAPDYWWPYNNELTREAGWISGVAHGGSRSIKIINSTGTTAGWHGEDVNFSNAYPTTLTFSAWAKAEDVASGGIFALDFYVEFEDGSTAWYYDNLRFSHGTHDWEKTETTKNFDKGVRKVRPYCLLYSTTGKAWFDDVSVAEGGGGDDPGLLNPDMEDGSGVPDYWLTHDNDLTRKKGWKRGVAHSGRRSLMIKNSKGKDAYWQGETISYSSPYATSLTLGGWAKATKVKGQGTFAIRFYIEFDDGSSIWYDDGLRFRHGTHGWEQVERTVTFSKGITRIRPYCILYSTKGIAWFDDVYANR